MKVSNKIFLSCEMSFEFNSTLEKLVSRNGFYYVFITDARDRFVARSGRGQRTHQLLLFGWVGRVP